ncbi:MAG: hypothetical protein IPG72_15415 [Ardenticatenales bacterium]|nr:hypothetical protein [Ardenticatenales bacterium]
MKRLFPLLATAGLACLAPLFGASGATAAPRQITCANPLRAIAPASQDTFVVTNVEGVGKQGEMVAGLQTNIEHFAFVQFAMPAGIPPDAQLCEVQLELFCNRYVGQNAPARKVTELLFANANRSWDENTLRYAGIVPKKSAPQWTTDLGECAEGGEFKRIIAKPDVPANDGLLESVQGWLDGEIDNNGLIIGPTRNDNLDDHRFFFATRDGQLPPPAGNGPRIFIFYAGGATPTFTPSASPTASNTPTPSVTPIPSDTPTPTDTPIPSDTPTPTDTPEPSATPTETPVVSPTPSRRMVYLPIGLRTGTLYLNEAQAALIASDGRLRRLWHRLSIR